MDIYVKILEFVSDAHDGQVVPGTSDPYLLHLTETAAEILESLKHHPEKDILFAVSAALLHDTIEDTSVTREIIEERFGSRVADAVLSLTKNSALPPEIRLRDSLERIKKQPLEVWMVKMADRISNLKKPPDFWTREKVDLYIEDSLLILEELGQASEYLRRRLESRLREYVRLYGSSEEF